LRHSVGRTSAATSNLRLRLAAARSGRERSRLGGGLGPPGLGLDDVLAAVANEPTPAAHRAPALGRHPSKPSPPAARLVARPTASLAGLQRTAGRGAPEGAVPESEISNRVWAAAARTWGSGPTPAAVHASPVTLVTLPAAPLVAAPVDEYDVVEDGDSDGGGEPAGVEPSDQTTMEDLHRQATGDVTSLARARRASRHRRHRHADRMHEPSRLQALQSRGAGQSGQLPAQEKMLAQCMQFAEFVSKQGVRG